MLRPCGGLRALGSLSRSRWLPHGSLTQEQVDIRRPLCTGCTHERLPTAIIVLALRSALAALLRCSAGCCGPWNSVERRTTRSAKAPQRRRAAAAAGPAGMLLWCGRAAASPAAATTASVVPIQSPRTSAIPVTSSVIPELVQGPCQSLLHPCWLLAAPGGRAVHAPGPITVGTRPATTQHWPQGPACCPTAALGWLPRKGGRGSLPLHRRTNAVRP